MRDFYYWLKRSKLATDLVFTSHVAGQLYHDVFLGIIANAASGEYLLKQLTIHNATKATFSFPERLEVQYIMSPSDWLEDEKRSGTVSINFINDSILALLDSKEPEKLVAVINETSLTKFWAIVGYPVATIH